MRNSSERMKKRDREGERRESVKETKWRRGRIGGLPKLGEDCESGGTKEKDKKTRERARDRGKEKERRKDRIDRKRLREFQHGLQEARRVAERGSEVGEREKRGREMEEAEEEGASTSRRFVFSLFPRGLLINYCD